MALIKCPECGREDVSDSAESCPNCGYGIKSYFEEIKRRKEEEIRNAQLEGEIKKQQKIRQIELEKRTRSITIPSHRPIMTAWQVGAVVAIVLGILMIFCQSWLFAIILIGFGAIMIYGEMDNLRSRQKIYDNYKHDADAYRKEMVKQQDFEKTVMQMAKYEDN